ncbi:hypothetical protein TNCT_349371 [Trichonephila clavata]|uniref:Uncharacterized protein n=1 Tax=Trichonephila clavata TaxID=2740835 RepID=A0A8X6LDG7_TRICU|nr:hypothetical protein TNCT_349371 [Trichonephila clavata]
MRFGDEPLPSPASRRGHEMAPPGYQCTTEMPSFDRLTYCFLPAAWCKTELINFLITKHNGHTQFKRRGYLNIKPAEDGGCTKRSTRDDRGRCSTTLRNELSILNDTRVKEVADTRYSLFVTDLMVDATQIIRTADSPIRGIRVFLREQDI